MRRLKFDQNYAARLAWLLVVVVWLTCLSHSQTVKTTAGGFVGDGGPATKAALQQAYYVVQDKAGNIYVSDPWAQRVRKIDTSGTISTFAGTGISGFSGSGGPANAAMLSYPTGLAIDKAGNIYIAEQGNNRVRRVNASGIISDFAGNGTPGYSGDGGPAKKASLYAPYGLAVDTAHNLYITDILNQVVRKVDSSKQHIITTYAGNGTAGYNGDDIPATQASLNFPRGMMVDPSGNLYIADTLNHRVRIVGTDPSHTINTFAGTGNPGFSGDGGPATQANVGNPRGVTFHGGALYIGNAGAQRVRYVDSTGNINTYAGSSFGYDGDNHPLLSSQFSGQTGLLFDSQGHLLVMDTLNGRARKAVNGVMKTFAGGFLGDGKAATAAALVLPEAMAFDAAGNYYIADSYGNRVREVDTSGKISTLAGTGTSGYSGDGGPAKSATLFYPQGVAVDSNGSVFIADTFNGVIRNVTGGQITTFITDVNFFDLTALVVDASGNLYSADDGACVVRKITPLGAISVVAGVEFSCGYNGDNIPATSALLNGPYGLALDKKGNLYLGDYLNNRVRKVTAAGIIKTITGDGNCGFSGDHGPAASAEVCLPYGVAVDSGGNVYLADTGNFRIREISQGNINTLAGSGISGYNGDGLPALSANLDEPIALALNSKKVVYFVDDIMARVRKIH